MVRMVRAWGVLIVLIALNPSSPHINYRATAEAAKTRKITVKAGVGREAGESGMPIERLFAHCDACYMSAMAARAAMKDGGRVAREPRPKVCVVDGCGKAPSYGNFSDGVRRWCARHKHPVRTCDAVNLSSLDACSATGLSPAVHCSLSFSLSHTRTSAETQLSSHIHGLSAKIHKPETQIHKP